MTEYELLDLRRSYDGEAISLLRFWISITFAVLVAAQVAGSSMGMAGVIAATSLYLLITLITAFGITRHVQTLGGLFDEIEILSVAKGRQSPVLKGTFLIHSVGRVVVGIHVVGFVGTFIYLLLRAGYIG